MNARAVFSVISFTEIRGDWATALSEGESKMSAIIFADLSDLITRGSLMPAVDIMQPPSRKKRTIRLNYTPEAFCCQGSCRCLEYMSSCIEASYAVRSFPLPGDAVAGCTCLCLNRNGQFLLLPPVPGDSTCSAGVPSTTARLAPAGCERNILHGMLCSGTGSRRNS